MDLLLYLDRYHPRRCRGVLPYSRLEAIKGGRH